MIPNRLTPLLQLIQGTAGTKINMDRVEQMLQGWGRLRCLTSPQTSSMS